MNKIPSVWNPSYGEQPFSIREVISEGCLMPKPIYWKNPRLFSMCTHSDLFHEDVADEWIDWVFAVMALCPQHTFQLTTKYSQRMSEYIRCGDGTCIRFEIRLAAEKMGYPDIRPIEKALPNLWLGASIKDQTTTDERIQHLLSTPAIIRFASAESLLAALDLTRVNERNWSEERGGKQWTNALQGSTEIWVESRQGGWGGVAPSKLNWVTVGGGSGPGARPVHPDWVRSLRDQCATSEVPFQFKGWGNYLPYEEMDINGLYWPSSEPKGRFDRDAMTSIEGHDIHNEPDRKWTELEGAFFDRIGKDRAGRLLDGHIHDATPECSN